MAGTHIGRSGLWHTYVDHKVAQTTSYVFWHIVTFWKFLKYLKFSLSATPKTCMQTIKHVCNPLYFLGRTHFIYLFLYARITYLWKKTLPMWVDLKCIKILNIQLKHLNLNGMSFCLFLFLENLDLIVQEYLLWIWDDHISKDVNIVSTVQMYSLVDSYTNLWKSLQSIRNFWFITHFMRLTPPLLLQ